MATVSLATLSQSRKNSVACGSRKRNRALLAGLSGSVKHERGRAGHRVDDALDRGQDVLRGRPAARPAGAAGGPDQVEQVRPLSVVELQRVRDAVDDAVRDA